MRKVNWLRSRVDWGRRPVSTSETQAAAALRNCVKLGKPGSGKSTSGRLDIQNDLGKKFILAEDPHSTFVDAVIADNPRHESLFEVLDLDNPDRLFPVPVVRWSEAQTPGKKVQENEEAFDRLMILIGGERAIDPLTMPYHGQGWRLARAIMTHRNQPVDALKIWHVFRPGPDLNELLDTCWDKRAVAEVADIVEMRSQVQRMQIIGPFQRLTDPFLTSLLVEALLGRPGVPWREWMLEKKCVLVKASPGTPESVYRPVMGALRFLTVQEAMRHLAETGRPLPAQIHADEAARLGLGAHESSWMAQCRKGGVGYTLYYQRLPAREAFQDVASAIQRWEIFAQANATEAEALARELASFVFDSKRPKWTERRERVINRGVRREEVKTRGERRDKDGRKLGETESVHVLSTPNLESVFEESVQFERHDDVVHDWVRVIRGLRTGQRLWIDDTAYSKAAETLPLPKAGSTTRRGHYVRDAIARIQSRDHYFTPDYESLIETPHEINDEPEPEEVELWSDSTRDAASRLRDGDI